VQGRNIDTGRISSHLVNVAISGGGSETANHQSINQSDQIITDSRTLVSCLVSDTQSPK
jgi:hypothetical protein